MVSCRMFMLALHTIWRFCLSKTCGVREYLSGLRAETPCVPPPLRGTQGVSLCPDSHPDSWHGFPAQIRGGARPVTKPLAGCGRARIVGTIGGTVHRPRLSLAPHAALYIAPGENVRAPPIHTTQPPTVHRKLSIHPPMYPVNRPRAKDQR